MFPSSAFPPPDCALDGEDTVATKTPREFYGTVQVSNITLDHSRHDKL